MQHRDKHGFREIGWNGVRVSVPADWQTDRLDRQYILLEQDGFPVMEAKWDRIKGKFSAEKHLKRLRSIHRKQPTGRQEVLPWKVPRNWSEVLPFYHVTGFQWQGKLLSGKGLILFCKACGCATFLQFYQQRSAEYNHCKPFDYTKVLSSFQDHQKNGFRLWSVYDIRLELPDCFEFVRHSFVPGALELVFETGDCRVSFFRWSPASIILSENDLAGLARKMFSFEFREIIPEWDPDHQSLELMSIPSQGLWKKWRQKLCRKRMFKWAKLRHISEANRILAVEAECKKPLNMEFLKKLFSGYEVVQENK